MLGKNPWNTYFRSRICAANKTQVFRSDWTPRDADADMFVKMVKRLARGFGFKLCDRIRFEDPATGKKYV